jgi:hypothetical protein
MSKIRVVRVLEYVGEEEAVMRQLDVSLPTCMPRLGRLATDGSGPVGVTVMLQDIQTDDDRSGWIESLWVRVLRKSRGRRIGETEGSWKGRLRGERLVTDEVERYLKVNTKRRAEEGGGRGGAGKGGRKRKVSDEV